MAPHEFFFSLEVSSHGAPAVLVEDVALQVFRYVGCSTDAVADLAEAFGRAAADATAGNLERCDVQFRAKDGLLEVLVSSDQGRLWEHAVVIG